MSDTDFLDGKTPRREKIKAKKENSTTDMSFRDFIGKPLGNKARDRNQAKKEIHKALDRLDSNIPEDDYDEIDEIEDMEIEDIEIEESIFQKYMNSQ